MNTVGDTNEEHTGMTKAGENETATQPAAEEGHETGYFGFANDPNALGLASHALGQADPLAGGLSSLKDLPSNKENG